MYPKLGSETNFIPSGDMFDNKPPVKQIDQNCQKLFPKTSKLTKEFLDKVYISKLVNPETYVFTDEWRTRRLIIIAVLFILFAVSFFGIVFMWYTNGFRNLMYRDLLIQEGSPSFKMFQHPSPKPLVKVYLFNYTNVEKYEDGEDEKLNVEEIGPYVYEESTYRENIKFNGSYVSYQQKKSYKFIPELSKGRQNDIVTVPNMVMLTVAALHRYSNFLTRLTISGGLSGFYAKPFHNIAADRFIMGYDDHLYSLSKSVMVFQNKKLADKVGLYSQKVGLSSDVYTIHTGLGDINQVAKIKSVNGVEKLNYWSTEECNSMDATDGSLFSPITVSKKEPVKVFQKEICRTFDLVYKEDSAIFDGDIPSYKYVIPDNVFDSPDNYAPNQCYCEMDGGTCPIQGLFNTSLCAWGAPTFLSFPHFYRGDRRLYESITGLNPNASLHDSYFDLHPKWGYPMNGRMRLQVNIQIIKTFGFSQLDKHEDGLVLPMAWVDLTLEDKKLPQDMKDIIELTTHTIVLVESILKYGCIVIALLTLIPISVNIRYRMTRHKRTDSKRPLQRQDTEC